ncbi:hypothetical protein DFH09DRAFT_1332525 [Mycena vulgaris]|nr:hypothetical protein DFH09DRAFT_1332525 [Mycena vulgaris]
MAHQSTTSYRESNLCLPHVCPSNHHHGHHYIEPRPKYRIRYPAADEWTQTTNGILDPHRTANPQNIPSSCPEEHAAGRSGEILMATGKAYLPAQDDVQGAMANAARAAKAYLPSDLTPPHPPFATPDRALAVRPMPESLISVNPAWICVASDPDLSFGFNADDANTEQPIRR